MEALFYSLLCLIIFGVYDFFIAKPARKMSSVLLATILALGQFLIFLGIFFLLNLQIDFSYHIIYPLLTGLCSFMGILFYSKSVQTGYAGISSSIANAYPLITIFIATFFLGEIIGYTQYLFFIVIILGIFFLSFHINEIRNMKLSKCKNSLLFALGSMCMWAGFVTFFDISVSYYSPIVTICIAESGNIVFGGVVLFLMKNNIVQEVKNINVSMWKDIVTILFFSLFGVFFFAKAFETGELSFVSAITACSPAITTLLARVFLGEKLSLLQYGAIFTLILGISGLSYVSL